MRTPPSRRLGTLFLALATAFVATPAVPRAQVAAESVARPALQEEDVRRWLTYLASDTLQGREVFSEGYGLAASYVAAHLESFGLKPLGDNGSFLQAVKQQGYRVVNGSSVVVEVGGQTRTFQHGDHVTFALDAGGPQTLTFDSVEFGGYGLVTRTSLKPGGDLPPDVKGKLVAVLPRGAARTWPRGGRPSDVVRLGVGGVIALSRGANTLASPASSSRDSGSGPETGRRPRAVAPDLTTVDRVDSSEPPVVSADEAFFEFLFSTSATPFSELRAKADKEEPLAAFALRDVRVTIHIDNRYEVVSTNLTTNVVGMVEGTDPVLKNSYVFLGAHLDHVGYSRNNESKGRAINPLEEDKIWNGADDDGSGSAALMAIAKAFATGPKPRRSVVFVWHAGEEAGLLGSRYITDFPVVPLADVQAQINVDMIGRNRDNNPAETDKVYVIGADRISTDLHNAIERVNSRSGQPMRLDYEFNDAADPNNFYTRSDHYSYASKGIPVAFFMTGLHPDYHANSDSVEKIVFPKLVRIAEMIYAVSFELANESNGLRRDNLGPRAGKGHTGELRPAP